MMRDVLQEGEGKLTTPEIRVWCHPHYTGRDGDDYYETFPNIGIAEAFIPTHAEAEESPLVAYDGYEFSPEEFRQAYPEQSALLSRN